MATFDCKRCGGVLEIIGKGSIAKCKYCGTEQTIPRLLDDKIADLYERAGHLRRNSEYDRALDIYETILNETPNDAEAYWSIILCRYGLVYVEDPKTKHRLPTITRIQNTSLLADEDYKAALKYADSEQRAIYVQEAQEIERIREKFLTISREEKPYDVFICYKDKDDRGNPTEDRTIAMEIYNRLHREGLKVFFAHITLDDKLGHEYEPYIFAALNSAKVMIVLGTRPEYFTAPWLKNEWSRFISLIKAGEKKTLISAFKNMNGGELPDELRLQAQDMTKMGFLENLVYVTNREIERNGGRMKEEPSHETVGYHDEYRQPPHNPIPPAPPRQKKKKGGIWVAIAAILLIGGLGIAALGQANDGAPSDPNPIELNGSVSDTSENDPNGYGSDESPSTEYTSNEQEATDNGEPRIGDTLTDNGVTYEVTADGLAVVGYGGTEENLEIPSDVAGYPVRAIRSEAFLNNQTVRSLVIPASVTEIGSGAFRGCTNLTELVTPFVGESAHPTQPNHAVLGYLFSAPQHAESKYYKTSGAEGLTSQGESEACYAYAIPASLRRVTVTAQSTIPAYAFQNCDTLREIAFEKPISRIGEYAFANGTMLASLSFSCEQYAKIDRYAFFACTALTNFSLPDGVSELGANAFTNCKGLEELYLPESLELIAEQAFTNCTALRNIVIPDSVKTMKYPLFNGCTQLERITIPHLGENANDRTGTLGQLFSAGQVTNDPYLTSNSKGLTTQTLNYGVSHNKSYTSYQIPQSIREIVITKQSAVSDYAFMGCDLIRYVRYEKPLTYIGSYAFSDCAKLESCEITFASDAQIGDYAFYACASLPYMDLPDGISRIGQNAFMKCASLTSIRIPSTVKELNSGTFSACTSLYDVTVSEGVTTIGMYVFNGCTALTDITLPSSIKTMDYGAFAGCTSLNRLVVPFLGTNVADTSEAATLGYLFGSPSSYASKISKTSDSSEYTSQAPHNGSTYYYIHYPIPKSLRHVIVTEQTHVSDYAFKNCDLLTRVSYAKKITSIGSYAFQNCTALEGFDFAGTATEAESVTRGSSWNAGASAFEITCDYVF